MDHWTIVSSIISAVFGGALWNYMGKRLKAEHQIKKLDYQTEGVLLSNLIDRVSKLEALLISSSEEKEAMRVQISELTIQVTELKVEIKFLREENQRLREESQNKNNYIEADRPV
jgi:chromosome segregation ATPase|tara:strand:- start:362 stop:706 length:345 start_codon:yes stop_codon:yes gene_type:complete